MKNDFDFFKDKIENSGVNAPEDMGEDFALKAIENASPKPAAVAANKKPSHRIAVLAAAAASFVLIASVGIAVGVNMSKKHTPEVLTLPGGLSLRTFSERSEVEEAVRGMIDKKKEYEGYYLEDGVDYLADEANGSISAGSAERGVSKAAAGSAGSAESHSETYKQVDGVDEADIIKTDGKYIYMVNRYSYDGSIDIFSVGGDSDLPIAKLNVKTQTVSSPDEAKTDFDYENYYGYYGMSIRELYLKDGRLIVMSDDYTEDGMTSIIRVYDVGDINNITLLDSMSQSGRYTSSRMIGDTLYTVSSFTPDAYEHPIPVCGDTENPPEIGCDCIYAPEVTQSENFLVVSAYNTLDYSSATQSKAIFGAAEDIYCNLNNLYIYCTYYEGDGDFWYFTDENAKSRILKVDLTNDLSFTAYAEIPGVIDDQYALDEYNGNLRVATTSDDGSGDVNNLYVLDENLSIIGSVTGFAENESIKAVRYIGDTAYVITYKKTDPLFVIDLSVPAEPKILGEVKITGFSTMLVPVDENTLLGIGYYTQDEDYTDLEVQEGVKLALFDVSEKANPKVLDSISYKDHYSSVTEEPRALVYNPERNDYVIPLNLWEDSDEQYIERGGMLNFKAENGRLVQITKYTGDYKGSVERCVYVGDTVYMPHFEYSDYDTVLHLDRVKYE